MSDQDLNNAIFGVWYPIETAPKDRVAVLVADMDDINKDGKMWPGNIIVAELWPIVGNKNIQTWVSYRSGLDTHDISFMPTHWTPLPPKK